MFDRPKKWKLTQILEDVVHKREEKISQTYSTLLNEYRPAFHARTQPVSCGKSDELHIGIALTLSSGKEVYFYLCGNSFFLAEGVILSDSHRLGSVAGPKDQATAVNLVLETVNLLEAAKKQSKGKKSDI
jgi:hypothetical protein